LAVEDYDIEWLQEQIYDLQNEVNDLRMENQLLRQDLDTIKMEGCWRFFENPEHIHKDKK
jgi:regulator of replication initiation timing